MQTSELNELSEWNWMDLTIVRMESFHWNSMALRNSNCYSICSEYRSSVQGLFESRFILHSSLRCWCSSRSISYQFYHSSSICEAEHLYRVAL